MTRRSFPSWNPEGRGCKGGTGPTRGATMATYLVPLPDGTRVKKRSAWVHTDEAWAGIYQGPDGAWHCAGIAVEAEHHEGAMRPRYAFGGWLASGQTAIRVPRVK